MSEDEVCEGCPNPDEDGCPPGRVVRCELVRCMARQCQCGHAAWQHDLKAVGASCLRVGCGCLGYQTVHTVHIGRAVGGGVEVGVSQVEQSSPRPPDSALFRSIRETTEARLRQQLPAIVAEICTNPAESPLLCATPETIEQDRFVRWPDKIEWYIKDEPPGLERFMVSTTNFCPCCSGTQPGHLGYEEMPEQFVYRIPPPK